MTIRLEDMNELQLAQAVKAIAEDKSIDLISSERYILAQAARLLGNVPIMRETKEAEKVKKYRVFLISEDGESIRAENLSHEEALENVKAYSKTAYRSMIITGNNRGTCSYGNRLEIMEYDPEEEAAYEYDERIPMYDQWGSHNSPLNQRG